MKETIISQGASGCIYRYGFDCNGLKINKPNIITKIQRNEKIADNELEIGKKIQKIPEYENYFSPVLDCCYINLAKYNNDEIEKCEIINSKKKNIYKMCKIKYVGKNTLGEYIYEVFKYKPKNLFKTMTNTYIFLLNSLQLLTEKNIVHYDIKNNNIVLNEINAAIIIDFGRSFDLKEPLNDSNINLYKFIFFLYEPDFNYWCLDINMLMYAFNELGEKWYDTKVEVETIQKILNDTFKYTKLINSLTELGDYKKKQTEYFMNFVGKKWIDVFNELIKYSNTWDNYALAVTYYEMIVMYFMDKNEKVQEYINILLGILMATPDKRPLCEETLELTAKTLEKVKRKEMENIDNNISNLSKNVEFNNKVFLNVKDSIIIQKKKEARFLAKA